MSFLKIVTSWVQHCKIAFLSTASLLIAHFNSLDLLSAILNQLLGKIANGDLRMNQALQLRTPFMNY
jgi:hypothetical protein